MLLFYILRQIISSHIDSDLANAQNKLAKNLIKSHTIENALLNFQKINASEIINYIDKELNHFRSRKKNNSIIGNVISRNEGARKGLSFYYTVRDIENYIDLLNNIRNEHEIKIKEWTNQMRKNEMEIMKQNKATN